MIWKMEDNFDVNNCLKEQLSELSLLQSMYAVPDELEFCEDFDLNYINRFLDGLESITPSSCEFCLKILDLGENISSCEVTFNLPLKYPKFQQLNAFVRCNSMENQKLTKLNGDLRLYLRNLPLEEPRIFDCLTWIRENVTREDYVLNINKPNKDETIKHNVLYFERYWIYSHHIYSKIKRKNILSLSSQLNLSGFSIPGKPGVICVEGADVDCREFWDSIKLWSWKKIVVKHREQVQIDDQKESLNSLRKFYHFKEIAFDDFKLFLETHNCGYAFGLLFGFENKSDH